MHKMLEDVLVVDLTIAMAGPGCTKLLAEWGAEVIRIEAINGEMNRTIDYEFPNLNKKCLSVNLKDPRGVKLVYDLIEKADILVTNMRPKAVKKLGMDYESVKKINPGIVYGIITGYGEEGPDADAPGYDTVAYWARSGMLIDLPEKGSGPIVPPSGVGDIAVGIDLAAGLMAAYAHKLKTGKGEKVMCSLLAHGLYLNYDALRKSEYGIEYPQSRLNPTKPLINTFCAGDGKWFCMTLLYDRFLEPLYRICGREDLIGRSGYSTYDEVNARSEEIVQIIDEGFKRYSREELLQLLSAAGIPCSPILHGADAVKDPQAWANHYLMRHTYRNGKEVTFPAGPVQFGDTEEPDDKNAPLLGEHTREIMEKFGYTKEQVETYISEKVVGDLVRGSDHDWFSDYGN